MSGQNLTDEQKDFRNDHRFEKRCGAADMAEEQGCFNNEELPDCLKCERTGVCFAGCIDALGIDPFKIREPTSRIIKALRIAMDYGTEDGAHHKAFAIDQIVRALLGDQYNKFVQVASGWDKGV